MTISTRFFEMLRMLGRLWQRWQRRRDATAVQRRAIPDDLWKRTLVHYPFLRRRDALRGHQPAVAAALLDRVLPHLVDVVEEGVAIARHDVEHRGVELLPATNTGAGPVRTELNQVALEGGDVAFAFKPPVLLTGRVLDMVANQPEVVKERIGNLFHEFLLALGSVILVTVLLLPLRIAVISALNLANELIKMRRQGTALDGDVGARLRTLRERVEAALARGQQLEL